MGYRNQNFLNKVGLFKFLENAVKPHWKADGLPYPGGPLKLPGLPPYNNGLED
jgi:hypothetical protein